MEKQTLKEFLAKKKKNISKSKIVALLLETITFLYIANYIPIVSLKDVVMACILSFMATRLALIKNDKEVIEEISKLEPKIESEEEKINPQSERQQRINELYKEREKYIINDQEKIHVKEKIKK